MRRAQQQPFRSIVGIAEGAVSAEKLDGSFPHLHLPIAVPFAPMEAKSVVHIPTGTGWQYEPKWDGFRCLAFRDGDQVVLQSKAGQPLSRYFPELVAALLQFKAMRFVVDGEIVIVRDNRLSFDDLLMRIHPAQSRVEKLSKQTPCTLLVFDLLVEADGRSIMDRPLHERRRQLEQFYARFGNSPLVRLSPATSDVIKAQRWIAELSESGLDGVIAKATDEPYLSAERAMRKIKRIRSADCVIGGFRYSSKGGVIGSLLLGLYGEDDLLHHVGFTSSFNQQQRSNLLKILEPYTGGAGFTGNAPGGPSRWSTERSGQWEPLDPKLVLEVSYDHFSGGRFRHGTKFMRWRPEKCPKSCTFEQVSAGAERGKPIESLFAA